jgi:hypothetical protein
VFNQQQLCGVGAERRHHDYARAVAYIRQQRARGTFVVRHLLDGRTDWLTVADYTRTLPDS